MVVLVPGVWTTATQYETQNRVRASAREREAHALNPERVPVTFTARVISLLLS